MAAKVINSENVVTVSYEGRLDSMTASELGDAINGAVNEDTKRLVVDMKDTEYISSKGVRVMVEAYRMMDGRPMEIINSGEAIKVIFDMAGLTEILNVR